MRILAIIIVGCALALTSCSAMIERGLNADWTEHAKGWKDHGNPSGYPTTNQKEKRP